jgi:hypothetical protein
MPVRQGARLREMTALALGDLPVGDRVEGDLDGLVAVRLDGLHLHDRARAGLDHGHGGDLAALRIEDLRHAELPAEDAFHRSPPATQFVLTDGEKRAAQGRRARS